MVMPSGIREREHNKFIEDFDGNTSLRLNLPLDAFARMRFSSPNTIFDGKQSVDNLPLLFDDQEESGSGTSSTHSTDKANTTLAVSATTAGKRTRQTFRRFNYQPGKSQLCIFTGALVSQTTNLTGIVSGIGLYDDNNGIFFENNEGTFNVVIRTKTSGSVVNNRIAQSSWYDPMDGTGVSGVTIDFTKDQIFWIDFEWLGLGRVRWGFFSNGQPILAHSKDHTNIDSVPYMTTANLPIRYQIENDGTGAATSMRCVCQTVINEGPSARDDTGLIHVVTTGNTHVDANVAGTFYALVGIRLKTNTLSVTVKPINVSILTATADAAEWCLFMNPTVAGSPTYSDLSSTHVQSFSGATANTVTGGVNIAGGFVGGSKDGAGSEAQIDSQLILGAAIDGTRDTLVLAVRPLGSGTVNADVHGSITFRELA